MVSPISKLRIGHAGGSKRHSEAARSLTKRDCNSAFYKTPTAGQVVDTVKPITISWDTTSSCLSPTPEYVDIYLYAPGHNTSLIQAFNGALYSRGELQTTLKPGWWGATPSVNLQLTIVAHDQPSFLTNIAAGPIFVANYNATTDGAATSTTSSGGSGGGGNGIIQQVKNLFDGKGLSKGGIACAVIFPLLFLGIIIGAYVKISRKREKAKMKRFSQAVDKRMSTISTDWRSMSGASGNAAIRNSMAVRESAYGSSIGGGRPSSSFSIQGGGQAGVGARFGNVQTSEVPVPAVDHIRQARASTFGSGERISRVSFAADPRFSVSKDSLHPMPSPAIGARGIQTRSFHQGHSFDEPRDGDDRSAAALELQMSPTQAHGALPLSAAEINARASGDDEDFRQEVLQMPAMTLMRTGHNSSAQSSGEFVIPPPSAGPNASFGQVISYPAMPSPIIQKSAPLSPASVVPANALSPDDMLRAYAAGRSAASPPPTTPGISGGPSTGMRVLYAPSTPTGSEDTNPFRQSMNVRNTMYTESMYSGMADEEDDTVQPGQAGTAK